MIKDDKVTVMNESDLVKHWLVQLETTEQSVLC